MTGMGALRIPLAISRMAISNPPGVSRRMMSPWAPAFAEASIFCRIYCAAGGVMAELTVITSKNGVPAAGDATAGRMSKTTTDSPVRIHFLLFRNLYMPSLPSRVQFLHNQLHILPDLSFRPRISQEMGGMKGRHHFYAVVMVKPA